MHGYRASSSAYHMHFGYWRAGLDPLRRAAMRDAMNHVVGDALKLDAKRPACVVDLGCGAGATARSLLRRWPRLHAVTVTNVPAQNRIAQWLDPQAGVDGRAVRLEADDTRTGLPAAQADGGWAVESACYATGHNKRDFDYGMVTEGRRENGAQSRKSTP